MFCTTLVFKLTGPAHTGLATYKNCRRGHCNVLHDIHIKIGRIGTQRLGRLQKFRESPCNVLDHIRIPISRTHGGPPMQVQTKFLQTLQLCF